MTKEERQRLALERRQKEVEEKRRREEQERQARQSFDMKAEDEYRRTIQEQHSRHRHGRSSKREPDNKRRERTPEEPESENGLNDKEKQAIRVRTAFASCRTRNG